MRQKTQLELAFPSMPKGETPRHGVAGAEARAARVDIESQAAWSGPSMEAIVERDNLRRALAQVRRNKGAPGVDAMSVDDLAAYLKDHWPTIRVQLLDGTYRPQPVRRIEIPKASGGTRPLGIPTVLDRFIQQAVLQVLQADWDPTFSEHSFGFRPGRSAHQAVRRAQEYIAAGHRIVVDLDIEKFFDRVNHDILMGLVAKRVSDRRILKLIRGFLTAGVLADGLVGPTDEGTPQGGPLSPLLSNLMLDVLDQELAKRGHHFVRYADDCNIYVRSQRAGERVMASIERFLTVHARFKSRVRGLTRRTGGASLAQVAEKLSRYLTGWRGYFGFCETLSVLQGLDQWVRRRLRAIAWKQWRRGRTRFAELRHRGVSVHRAAKTAGSPHGPWRLSNSPALAIALPNAFFRALGLVSLGPERVA
jgi:RNA-directed DNA polymerase